MAPRGYTLRRRAEAAAATRSRIVEATLQLYRERGVAKTTIQAVAERADVSRGTVLNHFGTAEGLLEAMLDLAVVETRYPDPGDLEGAETREARIRRYVEGMYGFFDRSSDWWQIFAADLQLPALQHRERVYQEVLARFQEAAFGPLVGDRIFMAAVRAFTDFGPMYALRSAGLTPDEGIAVLGDALVNVAQRREAEGGLA